MGICVNLTAYAAKLCFQAAFNPMILAPYRAFGVTTELKVQDTSAFAENGEALSFWQMQVRLSCLTRIQNLSGLLFPLARSCSRFSRAARLCTLN